MHQCRFDFADVSFAVVDRQRCVFGKTNSYSSPLHPGAEAVVWTYSAYVEIWARGKCITRHERCYRKRQPVLDLEHYLYVLERKPCAPAGSMPLAKWRSQGRWPKSYDLVWQRMIERLGRQNGTREMLSLLYLGQRTEPNQFTHAITQAVELGCADISAVRSLLTATQQIRPKSDVIELGALARHEPPLPTLEAYDHLLKTEVARCALYPPRSSKLDQRKLQDPARSHHRSFEGRSLVIHGEAARSTPGRSTGYW